MKKRKIPNWLMLAAAVAVILLNAVVLLLIFRIEGPAFAPVLAAYAALLCAICAGLLRRRDIRRLSAELQLSEEEVLAMIRSARQRKRRDARSQGKNPPPSNDGAS